MEYNFKEGNIDRHFFLRKLTIDKIEEILLIDKPKDVMINNQKYVFHFNKDKSVSIINESGQLVQKIETNKEKTLLIEGENIKISNVKEIEFDGSFEFDNSALFDKFSNEVNILFNNVNNGQINSFNYIVMEIKLNKGKISELISQLLRDKRILEKIYNK